MSTTLTKEQIEFSEFLEIEKKLDIRMGKITVAEQVPKSDKLLKLTVDFGDETRTVVTNIGNRIESRFDLLIVPYPFIMNLKPTKIMGIESTAMIMIPENKEGKLELGIEKFSAGSKLL